MPVGTRVLELLIDVLLDDDVAEEVVVELDVAVSCRHRVVQENEEVNEHDEKEEKVQIQVSEE